MTADLPSAERFEDLVGEFSDTDGVTLPRGGSGFGRSALRYHGKIFAMFVRGDLVVKLPAQRVDELVAPDSPLPWSALAGEALSFARGASS